MPAISAELQQQIQSGEYRLVEFNDKGWPIMMPGEIVMNKGGILVAYTGNVEKKNDVIDKP